MFSAFSIQALFCFVFNVESLNLYLLGISIENSPWLLLYMKKRLRFILIFSKHRAEDWHCIVKVKLGNPSWQVFWWVIQKRRNVLWGKWAELKPDISFEFTQVQITFRLKAQWKWWTEKTKSIEVCHGIKNSKAGSKV